MKKNNIKYLMLAILGLSLFYSCNSMNNEPTDSYTDSKFWTSADKAQYVINMAYNQLYSASKMWSDECLSDNLFEGRFHPCREFHQMLVAQAS